MIDLPQVVDIVSNPNGVEFLQRDCVNICTWFASHGYRYEPDQLFAELIGEAFSNRA